MRDRLPDHSQRDGPHEVVALGEGLLDHQLVEQERWPDSRERPADDAHDARAEAEHREPGGLVVVEDQLVAAPGPAPGSRPRPGGRPVELAVDDDGRVVEELKVP